MKNRTLRVLCLGIILTLLLACLPAQAADDGDGKIVISFPENTIAYNHSNIRVSIYLLATGDYGDWTMTSNFSDIQVYTRGDGSLNPDHSLNQIGQRIRDRKIPATAETRSDKDGKAYFQDLRHGIYFVDYSDLPDNLKVNPMFLAVPNKEKSVNVSANAKANPQVTDVPETPTPTPAPTPTPVPTQTPSVPTATPTATPWITPTPEPTPHTLTIYYRYLEDDTTAWPTYFEDGLWPGTDYYVPSPVIPGYDCTVLIVEGRMPNHDVVRYVYYYKLRRGQHKVTIEDYETALGLGNIQMHVGVCFE